MLPSLVVTRYRLLTMEIPHRQLRTATGYLQLTTINLRLTNFSRWALLCRLDVDHTENTASNSSPTTVC
jgi:hypothetical protein